MSSPPAHAQQATSAEVHICHASWAGAQLPAMRLSSLCQTGSLPLQLNLFLMAFNLLLPAYPLDGGRILADLLLLCHMSEALAAKVVMVLAVIGAIGIAVWGWLSASILTIAVSPGVMV